MSRWLLILSCLLIPLGSNAQQTADDIKTYVHSPRPLKMFDANMSIGLALTILPQPLVESELPAPALDVHLRVGLPMKMTLIGRATSNYATSMATAGLMLSAEKTGISTGIGVQAGYFYGSVTFLDGFDTDVSALLAMPFVSAGFRTDDFTISGKFQMDYVLSERKRVETIEIASEKRTFNGAALTLVVEQPFWNKTHIALGVILNYSRSPYQAWVAFNTFEDYMFYPELFAGFLL